MAPKRKVKKPEAPIVKAAPIVKKAAFLFRNIYPVSNSNNKLETRFRVRTGKKQNIVVKYRRALANLAVLLHTLSL